jgi:MarR family transcriptional regulator, organic hydroperoxide resistance regulator
MTETQPRWAAVDKMTRKQAGRGPNTVVAQDGAGVRQQRTTAITKQLRMIFRAMQAHSRAVEQQCGLSSAKLWMMWELHATSGQRVSELARALAIHNSTCSNMLDQLEARDLVRRDRSRTDQRSVHISLTDQGKELLARAPLPAQGILSEALERLSDGYLEDLAESLDALVQTMGLPEDGNAMLPVPKVE